MRFAHVWMPNCKKCRQDDDPYATRYGCFLPDLTGLAGRPSAACLRVPYALPATATQPCSWLSGTAAAPGRLQGVQNMTEAVGTPHGDANAANPGFCSCGCVGAWRAGVGSR